MIIGLVDVRTDLCVNSIFSPTVMAVFRRLSKGRNSLGDDASAIAAMAAATTNNDSKKRVTVSIPGLKPKPTNKRKQSITSSQAVRHLKMIMYSSIDSNILCLTAIDADTLESVV